MLTSEVKDVDGFNTSWCCKLVADIWEKDLDRIRVNVFFVVLLTGGSQHIYVSLMLDIYDIALYGVIKRLKNPYHLFPEPGKILDLLM